MRRLLTTAALGAAVSFAAPAPAQPAPGAQVPPAPVAAAPPAPPPAALPPIPAPAPLSQSLTFDDAIRIALEKHPDAARAAQAILRAEALLQSSRSVFLPSLNGTVTTTILDEERGFSGQVTQPQTQSAFGIQASYPVLAASRWAQAAQ